MKGYIAHTLLPIAALVLWTGCGKETKPTTDADAPAAYVGLTLENMDTTVSPREDFFLYSNGGYIKRESIPADQGRWGVFSKLGEDTDLRVRDLLQASADKKAAAGTIDQLIGDYYAAAMDTAKIEELGIKAVQPQLDEIAALQSTADMVPLIAKFHRQGIGALFGVWIDLDDKNSSRYIVNLYQGGMGMPEKGYYLKTDPASVQTREAYVAYLSKLLELGGDTPEAAKTSADKVLALETQMAKASMAMVEMRNPELTYHKTTLEVLQKDAPNLDWAAYFKGIGLPNPGEFNVAMPDFMKEISKMVKSVSLADWKTYLRVVVLRDMAPNMSSDFVNADFEFNDKTLGGAQALRVRWKRVVEGMNWSLGMAIGEKYVEQHFSPRAKEIALEMVDNILATMKDRLAELTWLSDSTRQKAIHKVSTILPKIGYPDKWRKWDGLKVGRDSYIANSLALRDFNFQYRLDKIGKPVDKSEWGMAPQIVNAYYNPSRNEIVFPAGILQPPFFHENADAALNYGAFGAVIGHELIHAFDDAGSQYDADGNLNMWWTAEDRKNFEARADLVRRQYDAYVVLDSLHVNGQLTLGENIADIFGLRMSYYAWKRSLKGKESTENIQGFTPDQRFFLAFGQVWSGMMRDEFLRTMIATNPHSPGQFRVQGPLSNLVEFYGAFGVKEGDAMWRPDSLRADIW